MAPLSPFCSLPKGNGEHCRHKDPNIPCLYCGLNPATFIDSDDEDCVEINNPNVVSRLNLGTAKAVFTQPLAPATTAQGTFKFAPYLEESQQPP